MRRLTYRFGKMHRMTFLHSCKTPIRDHIYFHQPDRVHVVVAVTYPCTQILFSGIIVEFLHIQDAVQYGQMSKKFFIIVSFSVQVVSHQKTGL